MEPAMKPAMSPNLDSLNKSSQAPNMDMSPPSPPAFQESIILEEPSEKAAIPEFREPQPRKSDKIDMPDPGDQAAYAKVVQDLRYEEEKLADSVAKLTVQERELEDTIKYYRSHKKEVATEIESARKELQDFNSQLESSIQKLKKEEKSITEKIRTLEDSRKKMEQMQSQVEYKLRRLETEKTQFSTYVNEQENQIETLKTDLEQKRLKIMKVQELKESVKKYQVQIPALKKEVETLSDKKAHLVKVNDLKRIITELTDTKGLLSGEVEVLAQKKAKLVEIKDLDKEIIRVQNLLNDMKSREKRMAHKFYQDEARILDYEEVLSREKGLEGREQWVDERERKLHEHEKDLVTRKERYEQESFQSYIHGDSSKMLNAELMTPELEEKQKSHYEIVNLVQKARKLVQEKNLEEAKKIYWKASDLYESLSADDYTKRDLYYQLISLKDDIELLDII